MRQAHSSDHPSPGAASSTFPRTEKAVAAYRRATWASHALAAPLCSRRALRVGLLFPPPLSLKTPTMAAAQGKVIITCAVTGSIHTPTMSPYLPITPEEIADAAIAAAQAGAAIVHLYVVAHFVERRLLKPPLFIQSVFGIRGGIVPHPEDVMHMKRTADRLFGDAYHWSVLGAGRNQMFIAAMSAVMGGNVRVGLEDSLWLGRGQLAKSNAEQVSKARRILEELGLAVATPNEARDMLKLKGGRNVAF